jgi:outer membrane protein OmpA-like peptidoglycan-associated protein
VNSYIEGEAGAIVVDHMGEVTYVDSTIVGDIRVGGTMAEVNDHGGNELAGRVTSGRGAAGEAGSQPRISLGGIVIGDEGVSVGSDIRITDEGVSVGSDVEVTEGGVRVGDDEVVVGADGSVQIDSGGTRIVTEGDYLRIDDGASTTVVTGWREGGSHTYTSADTDRFLVELGAKTTGGEVALNLAGDVLFDFDSSAVRGDAASQLSKVAHVLRSRSGGAVSVVGHTDSVGAADYNQRLSQARALAVMRWLNEEETIPLSLMRGRGMGSEKPIAHNTNPDGSDSPEGRAKNRRVEIRFAPR